MRNRTPVGALGVLALGATALATPVAADQLDDIIASGELRCGIMLDVPPDGMQRQRQRTRRVRCRILLGRGRRGGRRKHRHHEVRRLEGNSAGTVRGTTGEKSVLDDLKAWGVNHIAYNSNAEQFLALTQGKVDAIVEATAIFGEYIKGPGKGKVRICCIVESAPADWTGP